MNSTTEKNNASEADWTHLRETVLLLEVSSGQIEGALTDSNSSVDVLTHSFTTMASHMAAIADTVATLPDQGEVGSAKQELQRVSGDVTGIVNHAIVAFQFYDKLVQRLAHVNHSLADLSTLVADQQRHQDPAEWLELQNRIRAKYSTEEEKHMFEAVMSGVPVKEALEQFIEKMKSKSSDDIELF